jgi:hypothetical protein
MEVRSVKAIVKALNLDAKTFCIEPYWKWVRSKGGSDLTFREKLEWLEEAETLSLRFRASREKMKKRRGAK